MAKVSVDGWGKRGDMSIPFIIAFIAVLLIGVIAAGVVIESGISLQEKSLMTADESEEQMRTSVVVVEVSATDGEDLDVEFFEEILRLGPGSAAVRLDQALLTMSLYDISAELTYRGVNGTTEHDSADGFYTLQRDVLGNVSLIAIDLGEDYDMDGAADQVNLNASGFLQFWFSSGEQYVLPGVNCSGAAHDVSGTYTATGSEFVEHVTFAGTCGDNNASTDNVTITVTPTSLGEGFFTVTYLHEGTMHVPGRLQHGDVIRMFFEAPREVEKDELVRLDFIPKVGTPSMVKFASPEVITTSRVFMYPPS
ncbi:hypothetical protein GF367_01200 [Candidatus Woesearchaeota archaeon]|nr:hypothetical protein [Candidatus Woesearchaeota archaeon]